MARLQSELPIFAYVDMKFMMAAPASPRSDSPETLLSFWMLFARRNKALHEAARAHYVRLVDGGLITAVVMGNAGGLIYILLGTGIATGADLNISQVALYPQPSLAPPKQLQWEAKALLPGETAMHYAELAA